MVHWLNPCFCSLNSSETQVKLKLKPVVGWLDYLYEPTDRCGKHPPFEDSQETMASPQLFGAAPEKPLEASALEVRVPAEAGVEWFYTCIQTIPSRLGGFLVMFFHHYTSWKFPKTSTNWADSHSNLWSFESGGSWMCSGNHGDLIFCMISMVKNWRFGNWFHDCQTS